MTNEILEWALKYHKAGFSIIPIEKGSKMPQIEWKKYQTIQPTTEEVNSWFRGQNAPNIGIITGKVSGITVVDVEKGGKWQDLPSTMTVKTGGGGYHLYYKYAPGIRNSVRIRELTDIRGDGGFVVACPSIHQSGMKYEFVKKENPQPFPYKMFNVKPEESKDWLEVLKGIPEGERNQTAASFIGYLLNKFPPSQWQTIVWEMVVLWNMRNNPPLNEKELRATFNSITGTALRTGKHCKEVAEIPEDYEIKLISEIAKDLTDDITISYPTGFKVFDKAFMGGLKEGDLIIISGYSGQGKTLYAQSMTYNLIKSGQPCLWFSFEVPIGELWRKFKDMGVSDDFLAYAPEKNTNRKIEWVEEKIRQSRDTFKTKVVFLDHLGFLAEDPANYDSNLTSNYATKITMICRRLKTLAIQENVVIVLLAHVKKPNNAKDDPTMHDLKDSSGIAQESDGVLIINRKRQNKGYSGEDVYETNSTVRIEKNRRTGENKVYKVSFNKGRLEDYIGENTEELDATFDKI